MRKVFFLTTAIAMFITFGCESGDDDTDVPYDTGGTDSCSQENCWDDGCDECIGLESLTVSMNIDEGQYDVYRCCDWEEIVSGPHHMGYGTDDTTHQLEACKEEPGRCYKIFFEDVSGYYTPDPVTIELVEGDPVRVDGSETEYVLK